MRRRDFLIGAGLTAAAVYAKSKIDRSRISAISDEVATSPDGAIAFARQYGLEWLELRNVPGQKTNYFYMDPGELKPHAKAFADAGIRISFLNTSLLKFGLPGTEVVRKTEAPAARENRLAREQAMFDRRMDDLRKCIRSAQILGVDRVRVFTFLRVAEPQALYPRIAEILDPMLKLAANEGIRLLVENEPSCNVGKCSETAAILNMLPSKSFGTNWDALNGAALGETPFPDGYAHLPKNRIWNVQIKGKSLLESSQLLPWTAIFQALDADGYAGELGLETHYFDGTNIEKSHLSMQEILRLTGARS